MLMNYVLMENDYLPVNIKTEDKIAYFETLDEYGKSNILERFIKLVDDLEKEQLDIYNNLINQTLENNIEDKIGPEI